ncbi:MAG: di-trans,poly-cis-decaprenylcistransferase [Halorhodospira halophila]|uniref:polyprenyl diphosphate synthase n=1 Tax=Halorhodospira TaxID=85108 RepID=UPI00191483D4|nr:MULTISPECIES: polyprenyl diphosphate synthase [Halorhodospira]MBK5937037.1 di-trans,poly-cis-decaprenylcistransferase [Halorhodospira halophila]MCC3750260.1 di-trans,poly-cis-decaprenylcistransferase [Halorhodospira halophila]MCG5528410.1 di-trans,poly-cis-decaprenylcistransferase [Halorhodospira halophila]MCG5532204.1 di-trans,poly-cis-decaprenylcistransferase [Halorhodospira sp. 9621]MCG5537170.1 di-trans,poly-cis-decaprenylcistransferase [Halorhodospira sp. 9622]
MAETNGPAQIAERLAGVELPRHIAIVMDGNGRWAQRRGQPRYAGHRAGVRSVREVVEACGRLELEALTLFAFSSENWRRPRGEVRVLMELFRTTLDEELQRLHENGVRLSFIGDRAQFNKALQRRLVDAETLTAGNTGLNLIVATSYGGRWEIAEAARHLAASAARGEVDPQAIDEEAFRGALSLPDVADPDLFIRTGGERRISNFLLWQMAYTELHFAETLWPEFGTEELARAIEDYAGRDRRFGAVSSRPLKSVRHA